MIQVCIFVPFLASDTPKPTNVNKTEPLKESEQKLNAQIATVLEMRNKIIEVQQRKLKVEETVFGQNSANSLGEGQQIA